MEKGLELGLAFAFMLCGCTGQTEVKTIPTTITSAVQNISLKSSSTSVLVSNIDVDIDADKLTYQNLCPSEFPSGFILINNRFSVRDCTRSDNIYLFLQESIVGQEDSKLIDVMRIPRKSAKDVLITMRNCIYQGQYPVSREFLANLFILARDVGNGDFKVMRVWQVNFSTRHFEPLSSRETSLIASFERAP
jgi:hypothetical protein